MEQVYVNYGDDLTVIGEYNNFFEARTLEKSLKAYN